MATPVQVGARNDLYALKEARRYHRAMHIGIKRALGEVTHMRETVGRPDYNRITAILSQLALDAADQREHLEEMRSIRERAKLGDDVDDTYAGSLFMRVTVLEAELAELKAIGERVR